jgi:hypothetical protein
MDAIIHEPISQALALSTATITLALNADERDGWKTEAQRLAIGAKRRARAGHSCK